MGGNRPGRGSHREEPIDEDCQGYISIEKSLSHSFDWNANTEPCRGDMEPDEFPYSGLSR